MGLVTWFPRVAAELAPRLLRVAARASGIRSGTAIVAAAHLDPACAAELAARLTSADDRVLAIHAACASALSGGSLSAAATAILTAPLGDVGALRSTLAESVGELVARCLVKLPPSTRDDAVRALIQQLVGANPMLSLSTTRSMLELVFGADPAPTRAASLTATQKAAVGAIAEHGAFAVSGDGIFANYALLMRGFGLPDSREGVLAWLAD